MSALLVLLALLLQGCMLQGGLQLGRALHTESGVATAWGGQVAAGLDTGLHAAVEIDGRAEHAQGSSFGTGLQLGYTFRSLNEPWRLGLHTDWGVGLGWSAVPFWYGGGTLELPLRLSSASQLAERNRNFKVIGSSPWLVPFVRYRFREVHGTPDELHDLCFGIVLRAQLGTDLL